MTDEHTDESDSGRQPPIDDEAREWRPVAHRSFERTGDADLSTVIIETVAAAEGIEATTIRPPLFEAVNVPAIEALFFGRTVQGSRRTGTGSVHFRYRGYRVTVASDGQVTVAEPVRCLSTTHSILYPRRVSIFIASSILSICRAVSSVSYSERTR